MSSNYRNRDNGHKEHYSPSRAYDDVWQTRSRHDRGRRHEHDHERWNDGLPSPAVPRRPSYSQRRPERPSRSASSRDTSAPTRAATSLANTRIPQHRSPRRTQAVGWPDQQQHQLQQQQEQQRQQRQQAVGWPERQRQPQQQEQQQQQRQAVGWPEQQRRPQQQKQQAPSPSPSPSSDDHKKYLCPVKDAVPNAKKLHNEVYNQEEEALRRFDEKLAVWRARFWYGLQDELDDFRLPHKRVSVEQFAGRPREGSSVGERPGSSALKRSASAGPGPTRPAKRVRFSSEREKSPRP